MFDANEKLMNVACIILMYGEKQAQKTIGWRSVTSGYHGSKISGLHQSFLTETVICIVKRWKKRMGYRLVPECNYAQKSHTSFFFSFFFSVVFTGARFVDIQKFCYHGNVT